MVDLNKLLSVSQAAKRCPLSEPQIRVRINDGRLPAVRIAGGVYVHEDALDEFLKQPHHVA
jgi:excisionase family DNA binding protein